MLAVSETLGSYKPLKLYDMMAFGLQELKLQEAKSFADGCTVVVGKAAV